MNPLPMSQDNNADQDPMNINLGNIDSIILSISASSGFLDPFPEELEPTPIRTLTIQATVESEQTARSVSNGTVSQITVVPDNTTANSIRTSTGSGYCSSYHSITGINVSIFESHFDIFTRQIDNLRFFPIDIGDSVDDLFDENSEVFSGLGIRENEVFAGEDVSSVDTDIDLYPVEQGPDNGRKTKRWPEHYCDLVFYHKIHGHSNVTAENDMSFPTLLQWVKRQRYLYKLYKAGKSSTMTVKKVELLQKVNFVWNTHDAVWDVRFQELSEFRNKFGHCNVPRNYQPNIKLSTWVKRQRGQYNEKTMVPQRISRLESIGFVWDILYHRAMERRQAMRATTN